MPLEIFAILVPLGIMVIVLMVRYSGLSKSALLQNPADATRIFMLDFAGEAPSGKAILSADKRAAFIPLQRKNSLGMVNAMGDGFLTRLLSANDVVSFSLADENTLHIRFRDFTFPANTCRFANAKQSAALEGWLNKLETAP